MAILEKSKLFASPKMDSRIKSANVQKSERWIGYFTSPALIYIAYYVMSGTYLNQFYIDVIKLGGVAGGAFLVLLPVLSKIFDAITNLALGVIIDRTKTRQGKARPWLLISAPLLAVAGIMLYTIPKMSLTAQAIWVAVSYNLYFAFAFTVYNMSQSLLVPLSTRNTRQRDSLALFMNVGQSMIPGSLVYIVVPMFLLPYMGVDQSRWAIVMGSISALMLPAILLQYFFTKERISEDAALSAQESISLRKQIATCMKDKYWVLFFTYMFLYQAQVNLYNVSTNFFANWVLGTYNDGITLTLMNAIGQFPLGFGVFLVWPLAKKFGKRKIMTIGMVLGAIGFGIVALLPTSTPAVLSGLFLNAFGRLPTYFFAAMMAECMDHIEWKNGYRCDGFTATVNSVLVTIMAGISTSLFNSGLNANGYVPPAADGSWIVQNAATKNWIVLCMAGIPAVIYLMMAAVMHFFTVEDLMPQISGDIAARHRAEAEARGEVYYSPEERAAMEQEEQDRIAEARRLEELQAKCAKKGLNFEEEEAKYQAALVVKKTKAEAKQKKKNG